MSSGSLEILLRVCGGDLVLDGTCRLGKFSLLEKILSINANGRWTLVECSCCQMRGVNQAEECKNSTLCVNCCSALH